jgi:hypothetical protein
MIWSWWPRAFKKNPAGGAKGGSLVLWGGEERAPQARRLNKRGEALACLRFDSRRILERPASMIWNIRGPAGP